MGASKSRDNSPIISTYLSVYGKQMGWEGEVFHDGKQVQLTKELKCMFSRTSDSHNELIAFKNCTRGIEQSTYSYSGEATWKHRDITNEAGEVFEEEVHIGDEYTWEANGHGTCAFGDAVFVGTWRNGLVGEGTLIYNDKKSQFIGKFNEQGCEYDGELLLASAPNIVIKLSRGSPTPAVHFDKNFLSPPRLANS